MGIVKSSGHLTLSDIHDQVPHIEVAGHKELGSLYGSYAGAPQGYNLAIGGAQRHITFSEFYAKSLDYLTLRSGYYRYGGDDSEARG